MSLSDESDESLKRRGLKRSKVWPYCCTPLPLESREPVRGPSEAEKERLRQEAEKQKARADIINKAAEARREDAYRQMLARREAERLQALIPPPRTFAKSFKMGRGKTCFPHGCVPFEGLGGYGTFAVLSTTEAISAEGASLKLIGASTSALALAGHIGRGSLSLGLSGAAVGAGVTAGLVAGTVALLWPNNNFASDSAFYRTEEFADLTVANISARVNVKYLPEESVSAFGVYTGAYKSWQRVPVIAATPRGEQMVADLGDGIELIWTPAVDPKRHLGIPALEGAPQLPATFVFPEVEEVERWYGHPTHPPDYRDAIIWFPSKPEIAPVYISLNVREAPGVATGIGEDVSGIWLAGAGQGLGAPIPTRIADRLRGREFSSFGSFRKAFWKAVAADPKLGSQFISANIKRITKNLAPTARVADQKGRRISFELHHVDRVADGGSVYDMDNLRVTTPKNHIDIHKEDR
ncbi:MAG: S-type Pyocin [Pseudomonas sp.]|nr:S-type Pyocin [Pseudomonas sp.]